MYISSQGRLWPASEDDSSLVAAVQLLLQLTRRRQTKLDARWVRTAWKQLLTPVVCWCVLMRWRMRWMG